MKKFVNNPYVVLFSYLITLASLIWGIFDDKLVIKIIALSFLFIYLIVITVYAFSRLITVRRILRRIFHKYALKTSATKDFITELIQWHSTVITDLKKMKIDDGAYFKRAMESFCRMLRGNINRVFLEDFNVCVKSICLDNISSINVEKWKTKTLARDASNLSERGVHDNQCQKVSENTSFYKIINQNLPSWAAYDLNVVSDKLKQANDEYKNPDKNYKKYYSSTIVIPIAQKVENILPEIKSWLKIPSNASYHYLGFLCLDSKKAFVSEEDEDFKEINDLLIPIGEFLYEIYSEKLLLEMRVHSKDALSILFKGDRHEL